jgi:P4 family phage/plasmid primase-like protien
MHSQPTLLEAARDLLQRGWIPLPVPYREKNPGAEGWQAFTVTEAELPKHFNGERQNIGVLLGDKSGGRVDVDLDCNEAVMLAPAFLPQTEAIFGRKSKQRSHWEYIAPGLKTKRFLDVDGKTTLLELRSTGAQTIFPGSTHKETGELVQWDVNGDPARLEATSLQSCGGELAAACLLARHWPSPAAPDEHGARHHASLALAGGLIRAGWTEMRARHFLENVCIAANDEETRARLQNVSSTVHKRATGEEMTGWPTLAQCVGEKVVQRVCEWLNIKSERPNRDSLTPARWFAEKFPPLADEFGDAILEETDKNGVVSARDIGEDFLAATLSEKGSPSAPTVFVSTEQRFFTYSPNDGVFVFQREPIYLAQLSRLLLQCARACRGAGCETQTLEFRFRDSAKLSGVLRKARGLLEAPHDFFSTDLTEFIPCNNGMLRLSDRALLPFSPAYRRRNKLAVPFDASATCPMFLETLMRPALEADDLDLLQRWCGLALIGENLAQKLLILTGTPGGGKGTFVRVLTGIIGQNNIASLRPQLLGERFETGRFLGKTLLYGADVPENFLNQRGASVLKSLTGYDPMTLEFKNSNESPFIICRFNVIVTCNSRLTVHLEGDTDAWRRRLAIVDYHKPKPAHVVADLDQQILTTEASGVLNWMLEGLDKLRADGWQLYLSAAQQESVDNLLLESDGHTLFVKEALTRSDSQLTVPDCFAAYVEYCSDRGWIALSRNKFGQMIGDTVARHYGLTVRHDITDSNAKAQRGWRGLSLRDKNPQPTGKGMSDISENEVSDVSDICFSVGRENFAQADERVRLGAAIWRNGEGDQPVIITADLGTGTDGRRYVKVAGSAAGIPLDEIEYAMSEEVGSAPTPSAVPDWIRENNDEIEERAAIMEFDGCLTREEAEGLAREWYAPVPS